jgi:uncharacterized protein YdiU (UPF0061 family)
MNNMSRLKIGLEPTYTTLPASLFSKLSPTPVSEPKLIIYNQNLADELGLDLGNISEKERAHFLSGNQVPEEITPFAQAYAGHQFGNFTVLGDGRAIVLGEFLSPAGQRFDLQLKGSGRTPYSRGGDGRAAVGPMLREYIISEAMHALGVPTTRSLAVVSTGDTVYRETPLPGAVLSRIAASHIRVGTFEFTSLLEDKTITEKLLHYLIERHFPEIKEKENQPLALLEAVIYQQAELITHWMRVGFIHGVMNTDNMALSGETIDYGPCAFMDSFAPDTVFSSIDHQGRYAFANQPYIAQWNIARLAESLLPLMPGEKEEAIEETESLLNSFEPVYKTMWLSMMGSKLGLSDPQKEDEKLITDLLNWMHKNQSDYTNTFLDLGRPELPPGKLYDAKDFQDWHTQWLNRLGAGKKKPDSSLRLMHSVNPAVIPRNHQVEHALQAGTEGNYKPFHELLHALQEPYKNGEHLTPYQTPPNPGEEVRQTFCGT